MSSTDHLSELESLRSQVADLARELAERDRSMQDIREQSQLLRTIVEGTGAETGDEFFASLVTHLTSTLHVQYAVIGEVLEGRLKKIRTLAVSAGGALVDNFEYELAYTPCATALTQTFTCFDRDVQATFPQFQRLVDLGAESYCAVPLRTKGGTVIGLLVVMDTKPLENSDYLQSLLGVFAPRVAAEFERRRAEHERVQALADLKNVIETVPDIMFTLDTQGNMVKWNRRVEEVTGYSPEELLNKPALAFVPAEERDRTAAAIQQAFTEGYAELEGQMLTKDLRTIPYHWTGAVLKDHDGRIIGITGVGRDVSEKKLAERELHRQRRHLVDAQALAHLGNWEWELDSGEVRWSDEQYRIFGHEPGTIAVTYDTFFTSLLPDDHDRVLAAINDALAGKSPYDIECRTVRPNGEFRFIHARGDVHRDATGHPLSMAGTVLDITDRKQTEEALRASEERWRLAVRGSNDGIWDWNVRTGDVFFSSRWKAMRGFEDHEITNHVDEWRSRIHPDDLDRVLQSIDAYLTKQASEFCEEYRIPKKDGSYMWILDRGMALWNEAGTPTRMIGSEADISERKRVEEALRMSEERFNLATSGSNTGIWDWDVRTNKVYFSSLWKSMLGYEEHELLGEFSDWEERLHPDDRARALATVRACPDGTTPQYELEYRLRHKNGNYRWILARGVLLSDAEGKAYRMAGSHIDITEQKQTQEALAHSERQLQTVLDALPVGVWFTDRSGKLLLANPAAKQIWSNIKQIGPQATSSPSGWRETIGPVSEPHRWALSRTLTTGVPSLNETLDLECLDGTKKTIRNSTVPVQDEAGNILGAIVLNQDITILRRIQRALQLTQFSVDHAVEGFFWISPDAKILNVNEAACRMLEYPYDELTAMTVHDIDPNFPPEVWPAHWEELKQAGSLTFESKHWSKTGRVLDTEVTVNYLQYEGKEYNCAIMRDIGERKRADAALRVSEVRYRSLYDETPTMYFTLATDGTVLSVNRFGAEQLGYRVEELVGHSVLGIFYDEDKETVAANLSECLATPETTRHWEFRKVRKDGTIIWVREAVRVGQSSIGETIVLVTCEDITERKQIEESLRQSEERFRTMFAQAPIGIAFIDSLTGQIHEVNARYAQIAGRTMEELLGLDWMSISHQDDVQADLDNMAKLVIGEIAGFQMEKRYVRPDGTVAWIDLAVAPIQVEEHTNPRHLAMIEDITERKRAEEALAQFNATLKQQVRHRTEALRGSEERLKQAVDVADLGIFEHDHLADRIEFSPRLQEMFGWDLKDPISQDEIFAHVFPLDQEALVTAIRLAHDPAGNGRLAHEHRVVWSDGSIHWLSVRAQTWFIGEGSDRRPLRTLGAVHDITERKRVEERLAHLNITLEQEVADRTRELFQSEQAIRALHEATAAPGLSFDERMEAVLEVGCRRFKLPIGMRTQVVGEQLEFVQVWAPGTDITAGMAVPLGNTYCNTTLQATNPVCFEHAGISDWRNHPGYKALGLESYIGTKLIGRDQVYGTICFTGYDPLLASFSQADKDFVQLMARWISGELDRQKAQQALKRSEERYRVLYDETPTMYFTLAMDGTVRSVNRFGAEQLGYRVEELIGHSVLGLFHEQDKETVAASLSECLATPETTRHWEFRKVRKDGSALWVRETVRVGQSPTGEAIVLVTCEDITERKRAEHESHERAQQVLEMQAALLKLARLDDTGLMFSEGIQSVTAIVADTLAVERVSLWVLSEDLTELVCQDLYERSQAVHSAGTRLMVSNYPRYFVAIEESLVVAVSDALVDPRTSEFAAAYLLPLGITSMMDVPIHRHGKLIGVVCHEHVGSPREWSQEVQGFAAAVGELVVRILETDERKRAEEALRQSEERFAKAFRSSPHPVDITEMETGRCIDVNDACLELFGLCREEVIGHTTLMLGIWPNPEDRARLIERLKSGQPVRNLEMNVRTSTGKMCHVLVSSDIVEMNATRCLLTVGTDITDRKRAEEALRKSHAFIRQIIDTDPNFIFAKDREGRFTLVNKAVADAYGTTVENLTGKTDADFNPNQEEVAFFRQKDLAVMDTLQELFLPEEVITDSGGRTRWLQTVKRPILDDEGRAAMVLGASTDITERKRMEETLRQRERALRAAIEERERISQDLHDGILQSLFAVGLTLEASKSMMSPTARKMSGPPLNQAIDQLNRVMREIRNFIAGLSSDLLQGKDLPTALQHMLASLTENQATRVRLAVEDRAAKAVSAEQSLHLFLVIQEAVSNCIQHGHAQEAKVSLKMLKQGVRLSIRDNGRGFNPDATKRTGQGLGNMAARAKKLGGRFTVLSKVNEGTSIVLDLPNETSDVSR